MDNKSTEDNKNQQRKEVVICILIAFICLLYFLWIAISKDYTSYQNDLKSLDRPIKQVTGTVQIIDTVSERYRGSVITSHMFGIEHKLFKRVDEDMWSRLHIGDKVTVLYRDETREFDEEIISIRPISTKSK